MANIKIYLDPKKVKKNGEASIFLTINIQYKKLFFFTGISCLPEKWDSDTCKIRGVSKKAKDDNLIVEKCVATLNDIFVRYRLQNIDLTPELIKREWTNPARRIDFYAFFNEVIKERSSDIEQSTIKQHKSSIEKLKEYKPSLAFSEIDHDFIDGYRKWLKTKKGNDINTVYNALKNFRTYVSLAKRKGIIKTSPFSTYSLKRVDTDRVFLTEKEVKDLWTRYNKRWHNDNNQRVLRHFLFMCFTGLRISDFKSITSDNIVHDTLVYVPKKTKNVKVKAVKMPLVSYAKQLIADENSQTRYLFNCMSEQQMRTKIKEIVKVDGIYKDLSLHTGRHTFATMFLNKTKDVVALQRLLGHGDINQTMIYVHMTDTMIQTEMAKFDSTLFTATKIPSSIPEPGIN